MKFSIVVLLLILALNCFAIEKVRVLTKETQTSASFTKYVDVFNFSSASVQFNWDGAATATATFYASSDYDGIKTSALKYSADALDTLVMSSSATASYVKAFTTLPYKALKIVVATSATPTVVGIDLIGK